MPALFPRGQRRSDGTVALVGRAATVCRTPVDLFYKLQGNGKRRDILVHRFHT